MRGGRTRRARHREILVNGRNRSWNSHGVNTRGGQGRNLVKPLQKPTMMEKKKQNERRGGTGKTKGKDGVAKFHEPALTSERKKRGKRQKKKESKD